MASISDILISQGQLAAQARRTRGGQWAPLVQHLANLPNQIAGDRQADRDAQEAAFDRAQQRDVRQQTLDTGARTAEAAEATETQKQQMNDLLSTPGVLGPDQAFNIDRAMAVAREKGYADIADDILSVGKEWNEGISQGQLRTAQTGAAERSNQPAAPQGFTLSPGQQRFDQSGQPMASVPEKPPPMREMVVRGPNGRPVKKLVPESELMQGVEQYEAPRADAAEPLVPIIGPDGQPVLVPRSQAVGKRPASNREQGRPVISGDAGRIADFDTSLSDLGVLKTTLTDTAGATGTRAAIGASMPAWATDTFGWGTDAKKRQGVIDRVKQVIGKTLEGGVLRKEDEIKYEKILPTIRDTAAVAASKLAGLDAAITQRRSTFLDALGDAGYDTAKFAGRTPAAPAAADPLGIR